MPELRSIVYSLAVFSVATAAILVWGQGPFATSRFEYDMYRDYQGELLEWPYPTLITSDAHYLLVGPGKFGVGQLARGHDRATVQLRGALIARGLEKMLEIEPQSFRIVAKHPPLVPQTSELGTVTLTGEIVDTKCHLGVMNPGEGKVHRACAVRCISGGAPPGFLVRDDSGETRLLLLVGGDGRALGREVLDYVAEPVRISGRLKRSGTSLILFAEPRDFRRE